MKTANANASLTVTFILVVVADDDEERSIGRIEDRSTCVSSLADDSVRLHMERRGKFCVGRVLEGEIWKAPRDPLRVRLVPAPRRGMAFDGIWQEWSVSSSVLYRACQMLGCWRMVRVIGWKVM